MNRCRIFALGSLLFVAAACQPQPQDDKSFKLIPKPADHPAGMTSIRGTVTFREKPAAGVPVLLCGLVTFSPLGGFKCEPNYAKTTTDESGFYLFSDLKGNEYIAGEDFKFYTPVAVLEGAPPTYFFWQKLSSFGSDSIAPKPNEAYEVKPIKMERMNIKLVSPAQSENVTDPRPAFVWEEYPDVFRYNVEVTSTYGRGKTIKLDSMVPGARPVEDLPFGRYSWTVTAYDKDSRKITSSSNVENSFEIVRESKKPK